MKTRVLLAVLMLANSANAEDNVQSQQFYREQASRNWWVYGKKYPKGAVNQNDICFARRDWQDGSAMEFAKDLVGGEISFWIRASIWNFAFDEKDPWQRIRINLYRSDGSFVDGSEVTVKLLSSNTLSMTELGDGVVQLFSRGDRLTFIPPGKIQNAIVEFDGSIQGILSSMRECMKRYPFVKETNPFDGGPRDDRPTSLDLPIPAPVPFSPAIGNPLSGR